MYNFIDISLHIFVCCCRVHHTFIFQFSVVDYILHFYFGTKSCMLINNAGRNTLILHAIKNVPGEGVTSYNTLRSYPRHWVVTAIVRLSTIVFASFGCNRVFRLVVKLVTNTLLLAKKNHVIYFSKQQGLFTISLTTSRKALFDKQIIRLFTTSRKAR